MDGEAEFSNETVKVSLWHKDEDDDRFSLINNTEVVDVNNLDEDEWYALVAGNGGCVVSYDEDGESSTDDVKKCFLLGEKVKIDPNGGTSSVTEIELTDDVVIENPERDGYKFTGWTEFDVQGYALGLKANWEKLSKYTITYDANGGKGSMNSQVMYVNIEQALSENKFEKDGYTFDGWNTKADGTGTKYENKQLVKNLVETDNETINLYAMWKKIESAVVIEEKGGETVSGVTTTVEQEEKTEDINNVEEVKEDNGNNPKTSDNIVNWGITFVVATFMVNKISKRLTLVRKRKNRGKRYLNRK